MSFCIISFAIQLDKNVFPSPVLPVNKRFFSFGSSKFSMNFKQISLINLILSLGDISELYFCTSILSEYFSNEKLSKFCFSKFAIFDLLYSILNISCFKQLHITDL